MTPLTEFTSEKDLFGGAAPREAAQQEGVTPSQLRLQFLQANFATWMKTRSTALQKKRVSFVEDQIPRMTPDDVATFILQAAVLDGERSAVLLQHLLHLAKFAHETLAAASHPSAPAVSERVNEIAAAIGQLATQAKKPLKLAERLAVPRPLTPQLGVVYTKMVAFEGSPEERRQQALALVVEAGKTPDSEVFLALKGDTLAQLYVALSGLLPSLTSSPLYPIIASSLLAISSEERLRPSVVGLVAADLILANHILPAASLVFRHTNLHPAARLPSTAKNVLRSFLHHLLEKDSTMWTAGEDAEKDTLAALFRDLVAPEALGSKLTLAIEKIEDGVPK